MFVCVSLYFHTHIHIHIHIHINIHIHIHTHTYTHTYKSPRQKTCATCHGSYLRNSKYIHIHAYIHTYTHSFTHSHIHTHTYTYIHTPVRGRKPAPHATALIVETRRRHATKYSSGPPRYNERLSRHSTKTKRALVRQIHQRFDQ